MLHCCMIVSIIGLCPWLEWRYHGTITAVSLKAAASRTMGGGAWHCNARGMKSHGSEYLHGSQMTGTEAVRCSTLFGTESHSDQWNPRICPENMHWNRFETQIRWWQSWPMLAPTLVESCWIQRTPEWNITTVSFREGKNMKRQCAVVTTQVNFIREWSFVH